MTMTPTTPTLADAATDLPVLEMVQPMLGFPEQRRFALARLDDEGTICDLRSLEDPDLSFVVVPPSVFFDGYHPEVDDEVVALLGLESEQDLVTLVVVTIGDSPADATANLLAPVLINHANRRAAQVILNEDLPLQARLTPA